MNLTRLFIPLLLLVACGPATEPPSAPPASPPPAANALPVVRFAGQDHALGYLGAVAADPAHQKLYFGAMYSHDKQRLNLWVFDLDASGQPTGAPRKYTDHADPLPKDSHSTISFLTLDPTQHRLYLGVAVQGLTAQAYKPLVAYALDAQGEPQGPPEPLDIGNPLSSCMAVAFHPRLPQLWAVGWGGAGAGRFALDTNGTPAGPVTWQPLGGQGKYSIGFRTDGTKLYLGTYPDTIEVCDLDPASGAITNKPRSYTVPNGPKWYLTAVNTDQAVYFRGTGGQLCWFALDATGEPTGTAQTRDDLVIGTVALSPTSNRLVVTALSSFPDALAGQACTNGAQVLELTLGADGAPGKVTRESPVYVREEAAAFNGAPAVAVGTKHLGSGFLGNRFAGLQVRPTLVRAAAREPLPPAPTTVLFPACPSYLSFVYAPSRQRVYAATTNTIASYALGQPVSTATNIPCPDIVGPLAVDDAQGTLYAAGRDGTVLLRALDAAGLPAAAGESLPTGFGAVSVLALNPVNHIVYAVGNGQPLPNADPRLVLVPGAGWDSQAVVDPARQRLYVTSQYHGNENLAVWPLTPDGQLAADQPRFYSDGAPTNAASKRSVLTSIVLNPAQPVLYLASAPENGAPGVSGITRYPLDDHGDPTGAPQFQPTLSERNSTWSLALSPDGKLLYESGWGTPHLFVWKVGPAGELQGPPTKYVWGDQGKMNLVATPDGKRLLLGTHPGQLDVLDINPGGTFAGGLDTQLETAKLGILREGTPGPWVGLDAWLKDGVGAAVLHAAFAGATVTNAEVRFEFALTTADARDRVPPSTAASAPEGRAPSRPNSPSQAPTIKTISTAIGGNSVAFFAPRYGIDDTNQIAAMIESVPDRFRHYRALAEKYALKPAERPKQFIVANGLISLDSSRASLEDGLELLALLGHNTVQIWPWGNFAPADIRATAQRHGFDRFRGGVYTPPSYFDFDRDLVAPAYLDKWAADFQQSWASQNGTTPQETVLYHVGDEPGWYYPTMINQVATNAARLAVFHEYLKSKGFDPAFFGQATWAQVLPIKLSQAKTLPQRRLLFWTARFYVESMSRGFAAATAAMKRQFNTNILTGANLNNWPGRFFVPSPNKPIANNPDHGPDAAEGMPDWFDMGRKQAVSAMWTEDWFGDRDAQTWSIYADLLRCSAREGNLEFGSYVVGHSTGGFLHGARYKIMALAGHGAKAFDYYIFGPNAAFGDGWSEKEHVYRALADGTRMLGRAESLLYPGRPRAGTVAILFTQASQVWDPDASAYCYFMDLYGLHAALTHEQYPVDFIDDINVENGDLAKYGYRVLYVCGPNLSGKAQQAIAAWVKTGGTVALLPGAAMADEYNEPALALDTALGLTRDAVPRAVTVRADLIPTLDPVLISGTDSTATNASAAAYDQVVPLKPGLSAGKSAVWATTTNGAPVLVETGSGQGRVFAYGFWPGSTYWNSPDRSRWDRLPQGWSPTARALAAAPARLAAAPRFVEVSEPLVEACLLESAQGLAVTLLNWTGHPLANVKVKVIGAGQLANVESVEKGARHPTTSGSDLEVTLPLDSVDVLLLSR